MHLIAPVITAILRCLIIPQMPDSIPGPYRVRRRQTTVSNCIVSLPEVAVTRTMPGAPPAMVRQQIAVIAHHPEQVPAFRFILSVIPSTSDTCAYRRPRAVISAGSDLFQFTRVPGFRCGGGPLQVSSTYARWLTVSHFVRRASSGYADHGAVHIQRKRQGAGSGLSWLDMMPDQHEGRGIKQIARLPRQRQ
ncbi:hypothetical protein CHE29_15800 [Salmonella enterica]|nr:hypothetical protein CHE29_15800 [Salmonella enterica]